MFVYFRSRSGETMLNLDTVKDITLSEDGPAICVSFMDGSKRTYTFNTYDQQRNAFTRITTKAADNQ